MIHGVKGRSGAAAAFEAEEGLDESLLDGISGGAVTVAKKDEGPGNANIDQALAAAPQFQHTGETGAGASATTNRTGASASAGASAGYTQTAEMGGVTVTNRYTISAQAAASASPTGVAAGATVGAGISTTYDLGRGVQIETSTRGTASVGAAVGIHNNTLSGQVGAEANLVTRVEQRYQSGTFGNGATVSQTAAVESGLQAKAGGDLTLGAKGLHGDYTYGAGAYYRADLGVAVGNTTATGSAAAGVISPGSVSGGVTGGVGFDNGRLNLSFGGEAAVAIGGVKFEVKLDLQLFDNTHTVGSAEEIESVQKVVNCLAATQDASLTDEWRRDLREDTAAADQRLNQAKAELGVAKGAVDDYNRLSGEMVDRFNQEGMLIAARRASLNGSSHSPQKIEDLDRQEAMLKKSISDWERKMASPAEVERRQALQDRLTVAQNKADTYGDIAKGMHDRLTLANGMTFMEASILAEGTMKKAEADLKVLTVNVETLTSRQAKEVAEIERLDKAQASMAEDLTHRQADLAARKARGMNAPNEEKALAEKVQFLAAEKANLEGHRRTLTQLTADLANAKAQVTAGQAMYAEIKAQMDAVHPLWSSESVARLSRKTAEDVRGAWEQMSHNGPLSKVDRGIMENNQEAVGFMMAQLSDNPERLKYMRTNLDDALDAMKTEYRRLSEVVTDKGVLSEVRDSLESVGDWFDW